jgi:hypothetical protein
MLLWLVIRITSSCFVIMTQKKKVVPRRRREMNSIWLALVLLSSFVFFPVFWFSGFPFSSKLEIRISRKSMVQINLERSNS